MLNNSIEILSLEDIGCLEDIPETSPTIEGNAIQKARYVFEKYGYSCFADDTGLEVEVLGGEPGVYSARYAGNQKNSNDNIDKLLKKLQHSSNRNAQFITVISLLIDGETTCFRGVIKGQIGVKKIGEFGFGYDPIFIPDGYNKTFAEMDLSEKNKISHRALAILKLKDYLARIS